MQADGDIGNEIHKALEQEPLPVTPGWEGLTRGPDISILSRDNKQADNRRSIHEMEYYSVTKRNKAMPATT